MTTAARPTWAPAKGGNEQGGTRIFGPSQKYSSRDLAAHNHSKTKKIVVWGSLAVLPFFDPKRICLLKEGQDTKEELQKRNLREELEERERRHFSSKDKSYNGIKRDTEDRIIPRSVDADDSDVEVNNDDDSDDEDDDDEDDTEALMAELETNKEGKSRGEAPDQLQVAEELKAKEEQLLRGNPLLNNPTTTFSVKRRWDDDVVFKNQARGETKTPKRFINDTIRNDFHRKFLQKYMK
ncbi:protein CWC15 [Populus alba x Populus x berolinensis]|uniref:Protein CWC15 n=1 Tax=Populus alba x Populus x berolinensis TaxID=444605 RepID=A0AAD6RSX6_9ROSI|nr:protein CWC15 [Populus alba x Populus x berolinensis]